MIHIQVKRIYDKPAATDGFRILVDRLWPRGVTKEKAALDLWAKEVAPSDALRRWFSHDPKKWDVFQQRYKKELKENKDLLDAFLKKIHYHTLTLLIAAKDPEHNHGLVLRKVLLQHIKHLYADKPKQKKHT